MQAGFSAVYTPLSMWDFCSIAEISPITYHKDRLCGWISRNCFPYLSDRPTFRYSNFADLVAYRFAKFDLPKTWTFAIRNGISDRFVDSMLAVLEYQENLDDDETIFKLFLEYLYIDELASEVIESGIPVSGTSEDFSELILNFWNCWQDCKEKFMAILEIEEEMEFLSLQSIRAQTEFEVF